MESYSLLLLGDVSVGKSALTFQFVSNRFVEDYDPTIEDSYRKQCLIDNESCVLDILDTSEQYSPTRGADVKNREGFLLVYSITNRNSFENLKTHKDLIFKVNDSENYIPIVVVGNKCDLETARVVTSTEGLNFTRSLQNKNNININNNNNNDNNIIFFETSAKLGTNVQEVFFQVVRQIRMRRNSYDYGNDKRKCFIQ